LEIHRIYGNKKFTLKPDDQLYSKFGDTDYLKALAGTGTNMKRIEDIHNFRVEHSHPKPSPTNNTQQSSIVFKAYGR
jgi:hypothetical protein